MRALQRLVITAHWAAFLQGVVGIVVASAVLLIEDEREKLHGDDIPLFILSFLVLFLVLRLSFGFLPGSLFYGLGTVHCQNRRTKTMKRPHAILIGLSLMAAATLFKETAVKPAYAYNNPATQADVELAIKRCLKGADIN